MPNEKDPRILFETEHYRLVAPNADLKRSGLYLNGDMFLEVADLDSLGGKIWRKTELDLTFCGAMQRSFIHQVIAFFLAELAGAKDRSWLVK